MTHSFPRIGAAMLYNFTDGVRKVLAGAREQAIRLQHDHLGPEHMILALVREDDGVPARVLQRLGVDPDQLQRAVEESVPEGDSTNALGEIPFTSESKQVLEFAMAEARHFAHDSVGSEHLLLGLVGVEPSIASDVLASFDVTLERARSCTATTLEIDEPEPPPRKAEVTAERLGVEPVRVLVSPGDSTPAQRHEVHDAIAAVYRAVDAGESKELEDARASLADAIESLRDSGGNVLFRPAPRAGEEG